SLFVSGIQVTGDQEDNLVVKAYRKLQSQYNLPGIDVYLHKHIPFGAGMGGGSADAAFMLKMLKDYFGLSVSAEELEVLAGELGADCPFFCRNKPVFATGTGNVFSPVRFSLKGYHLVIVKPAVSVSTKEAFSGITPVCPQQSVRDIIEKLPIQDWKACLKNDFEKTVFKHHPELERIKNLLYGQGAVYASMSGSGSALFGIFNQEINAKSLFPDCFVWEGPCEY
ncbi:MAG: 4-(cytidine 5'-diphospho)-2-C-methyl-D-erythritol kinase, partial [Bacteroidales bacterium]